MFRVRGFGVLGGVGGGLGLELGSERATVDDIHPALPILRNRPYFP